MSVPERVTHLNGTLCHVRYAIVILRSSLPHAVPVDCDFHSLHVILHVNDDFVALAHLDARSGYHSVRGQDASLHSVRQDALAVAPYGVGRVRCAYLTRSENS